jgi:hypothetical protein
MSTYVPASMDMEVGRYYIVFNSTSFSERLSRIRNAAKKIDKLSR